MKNLKISDMSVTLRGESPLSGVPALVCYLEESGKQYTASKFQKIVSQGVGEVITFVGKPFRQLKEVSNILSLLNDKFVIIETSGRINKSNNKRSDIVPIVDRAAIVIKPTLDNINNGCYDWMLKYSFNCLYYKFVWQGDEDKTKELINLFFKKTNRSLYHEIENRRIMVIPNNIHDIDECSDVWKYCLINELRYSGREFNRLFIKEDKK